MKKGVIDYLRSVVTLYPSIIANAVYHSSRQPLGISISWEIIINAFNLICWIFVPDPELGAGDIATCRMRSLSRRSTKSGKHRPSRTCGPHPIEQVKGTGGGVLAVLGEQWTGTNQICWGGGGVVEVSREEAIFCVAVGEGKGKILITPPWKCAASSPSLAWLADAPSRRCPLHPLRAPGPWALTFAVAPRPPWASGSALLSQKGISFFEIRQPGPKELFSSIVQAWQIINFWLICLELWASQHSFRRWTAV